MFHATPPFQRLIRRVTKRNSTKRIIISICGGIVRLHGRQCRQHADIAYCPFSVAFWVMWWRGGAVVVSFVVTVVVSAIRLQLVWVSSQLMNTFSVNEHKIHTLSNNRDKLTRDNHNSPSPSTEPFHDNYNNHIPQEREGDDVSSANHHNTLLNAELHNAASDGRHGWQLDHRVWRCGCCVWVFGRCWSVFRSWLHSWLLLLTPAAGYNNGYDGSPLFNLLPAGLATDALSNGLISRQWQRFNSNNQIRPSLRFNYQICPINNESVLKWQEAKTDRSNRQNRPNVSAFRTKVLANR